MALKKMICADPVGSNKSVVREMHEAIPKDEKWIIRKFGACDINSGDNKSSSYTLRCGTEVLKIIVLTGNTVEFDLDYEIIGDGEKKINIVVKNISGAEKEMPFWIEMEVA